MPTKSFMPRINTYFYQKSLAISCSARQWLFVFILASQQSICKLFRANLRRLERLPKAPSAPRLEALRPFLGLIHSEVALVLEGVL